MKKLDAIEKLRLLFDHEDASILISGEWGIGKTFFVTEFLKSVTQTKNIRHLKVSAFGCSSAKEFQQRLGMASIQNLTKRSATNKKINIISGFIRNNPFISSYIGDPTELGSLFLTEKVIWLDDLERAASTDVIHQILGLCQILQEENHSKLIITANLDEIQYLDRAILEKTARFSFRFERDTEEIIEFSSQGLQPDDKIHFQEIAEKLELKNIRNLARARDYYLTCLKLISNEMHGAVRKAIATTCIVAVECKHSGDKSLPTIEELPSWRAESSYNKPNNRLTKPEGSKLTNVAYSFSDPLEVVVINFVANGSIDKHIIAGLTENAGQLQRRMEFRNSLWNLWGRFHNSFQFRASELASGFLEIVENSEGLASAQDYNDFYRIIKLCCTEAESIKFLKSMPSVFYSDLSLEEFRTSEGKLYRFEDEVKQRIIVLRKSQEQVNLSSIMKTLENSSYPRSEEIIFMGTLSESSFEDAIEAYDGENLDMIIKRMFEIWDSNDQKSDGWRISKNLAHALANLAAKYPENSLRCYKYKAYLARHDLADNISEWPGQNT